MRIVLGIGIGNVLSLGVLAYAHALVGLSDNWLPVVLFHAILGFALLVLYGLWRAEQ